MSAKRIAILANLGWLALILGSLALSLWPQLWPFGPIF